MHSELQDKMKFYSMATIHFENGEHKKSPANVINVKYDLFGFKMV